MLVSALNLRRVMPEQSLLAPARGPVKKKRDVEIHTTTNKKRKEKTEKKIQQLLSNVIGSLGAQEPR